MYKRQSMIRKILSQNQLLGFFLIFSNHMIFEKESPTYTMPFPQPFQNVDKSSQYERYVH